MITFLLEMWLHLFSPVKMHTERGLQDAILSDDSIFISFIAILWAQFKTIPLIKVLSNLHHLNILTFLCLSFDLLIDVIPWGFLQKKKLINVSFWIFICIQDKVSCQFSPKNIAIEIPNYLPLSIILRKVNLEVLGSPVVVKTHPKFMNCLFYNDKPRMLFPVSSCLVFCILYNESFLSSLPFPFGIFINISH